MKWMFKLLMLMATLWSGYWYVGYRAQKELFSGLLENSRIMGWVSESQELSIIGYPNRFDTTLTDFRFQSPDRQWGWAGESFQIKALSYKPNHVILAWPGEQMLQTPEGDFSFNAELLLASLVLSPTSDLPLSRLQLEGEAIALSGPTGQDAMISTLNAALFQDEATPTRYRLGVDLQNITLPDFMGNMPVRGFDLPDIVEQIRLSTRLDFDREIDRTAMAGSAPKPIHALIEPSTIRWGEAELTLEGELSAANNGYVEGELSFEISNWQPLFEAFKQLSSLSTTEKLTLKRALDGASSQNGLLVFTLRFENGQSRIGPFTIGPAPIYPF